MYRTFTRFLTPVALVMCLVPLAAHGQRRSFAGSYQLSSVTQSGNSVEVTVTLTLTNYSGGDIRGGNVVLLGSSANPQVLGKFSSIQLFANTQLLKISQAFSVPKGEYALWQAGRDPVLRFQLPGSNDPLVAKGIDLRRVSLLNPAS